MEDIESENLSGTERQVLHLEDKVIHTFEIYFVCWSYETLNKALYPLEYRELGQTCILLLKSSHPMEGRSLQESNLIGFWRSPICVLHKSCSSALGAYFVPDNMLMGFLFILIHHNCITLCPFDEETKAGKVYAVCPNSTRC